MADLALGDRTTRVFAGMDEAGFGSLLGPLTLGYSAFRVPRGRRLGGDFSDYLWERLVRVACGNGFSREWIGIRGCRDSYGTTFTNCRFFGPFFWNFT